MKKNLIVIVLVLLTFSACGRKPSYKETFEKTFDKNVTACADALIASGEDSTIAVEKCSCMLRAAYEIDSTFILMNPKEQHAFIEAHIDALYESIENIPDASIVTYTIASRQGDCVGVAPQKCMLIKKEGAEGWEFFYSNIEGFQYEPGYEYVLKVREEKKNPVPADASSIKYVLVKEVSKVKKNSEYLPESI